MENKRNPKNAGRKKVEDKIVQAKFNLRRSDWEAITGFVYPHKLGQKKMNLILKDCVLKNGIQLKK